MSDPLVFLCNPPTPFNNVADREAAYGMGMWLGAGAEARAPHTLAWCAAQLQQAGWQARAVDAVAERLGEEECLEQLIEHRPPLLVLLSSPTTAQSDLGFVHALRRHLPSTRLLLVGLASHYLPHSLVEAVDMVLLGEPESAIDAACRCLLSPDPPRGETTPQKLGVAGYDSRNHVLDLASLAPPAWELFPVRQYKTFPILAGRGCLYACRYCAVPVTEGRGYRMRDAASVAEEMDELYRHFDVRRFHFWDPVFATIRQHAEALCDALVQRDLPRRIGWSCETRPEQVDLRLLQHMKRAGCIEIHLGLESVSPETLLAVGRVPDPHAVQAYLTRVREIVLGCRAFEMGCHLHVLAGLPGNRSGATTTRTFLRAYSSHAVHVSPLIPYPGTSIFPSNQVEHETRLLEEVAREAEEQETEPARSWKFLSHAARCTSA